MTDDAEQKRYGFEEMCKGWAKGSKAFKQAVLDDCDDIPLKQLVESDAKEMREPFWEHRLSQSLKCLGKTPPDLKADRKGAAWKVALARHLRESHLIPNVWLAESLHMGTPNSLSSQISRHRKANMQNDSPWELLENQENVD